ncbi:hypothetical protein [Jannaschia sp. LMIT008]|uniref:hypothetical protein n=1 Tax=Jannaschia maritima TaxID=3032585 RepID=UPI002811AAD5|nr:hypothetical protein [Jannaschia sp. LMIT008]
MPIELPPRDTRVHVFSVSEGGDPIPHQTFLAAGADGAALRRALGAEVDTTHAEVFAVKDIAGMGLRDYVAQAHDVPREAMAGDAAKLDHLSGDVIVLSPRAVEGVRELDPAPHLTHVGAYQPEQPDAAPRDLPPAEPASRPATPAASTGPTMGNRTIVWIVLGAVVLAALLVLLAT